MAKREFTTGLREKHALPYGFGHVAIIADRLGTGEPIYSIEIFEQRTLRVERVRCYTRLKDAQRHLSDIHAGASYVLHLQHRPDPQDDEADEPEIEPEIEPEPEHYASAEEQAAYIKEFGVPMPAEPLNYEVDYL